MGKIKDSNYYQITGFMINKLNLKGTALNVYAIIYGFTQDGETEYSGSRQYLADFCNTSRQTIDTALAFLCNKGYIIKITNIVNGIIFNRYKVDMNIIQGVKIFDRGCQNSLQGGCKETMHNNIKEDNNIDNKKERKAEASYDDIINQSVTNEDTKAALYEFIKMRKLIKKPMTNRALELLIGRLNKLANANPAVAVEILNQSITNNWQDIYPIKENNNVITQPKTKKANFTERTYSKDDMDKMFSDIHDVDNIDF